MNSLVSIIVPNYNHANYLKERLDSIFNQNYQDIEVIILDDASTDASLEVISLYINHPKVSNYVVNSLNSGSPFKQWQKGIELAKGDYIWIAESDDYCELNFLESQIKMLQNADVSVAKTLRFTNKTIGSEVKHHAFTDVRHEERILFCPILNVSSVVFKTDLLRKAHNSTYNNFKIIGDRVFYYEYFRNGNMVFNPNTINYFRQSALGVSNLQNRSLTYLKLYFDEHCRFIFNAKITDNIKGPIIKKYIKKFYNRLSNRVSKKDKKSLTYLRLFILYKYRMVIKTL